VQAVDELAGVAVQITAGHVEKWLGDRRWVRSSWEALAANLGRSATSESDPFAAMRVASVMRVNGGEHAAGEKPSPRRPHTGRNAPATCLLGVE